MLEPFRTSPTKETEERLRQWATVFESTTEAVLITDSNLNIIDINRAYSEITGYQRDEVIGQKPNLRRSDRHDAEFYEQMWNSINCHGCWSGEIWNRNKNGELSPEWLSISTLHDEVGEIRNYIGVFTDISVLKQSEEKLEHLANHDPLTGLANRLLLNDRLESAIKRMNREQGQLAVLFLDLDRFKVINDTLGHPVGDTILQQVAKRLSACLRANDTLGRLGGDEFLVLIEGFDNVSEINHIAEKLRQTFTSPFRLKITNSSSVSASASVSTPPMEPIAQH
ncbi:diguanylate cyclase domain-containing protein [Candidatus Reidiella endopervernicosa]|uniref:Diguanylate cyclase n=1 Tax=Candidatus Reidiella endopervernicosa TaxID=2738883 RepID=A0A6N0HZY1_9GAMM|nr:diguanylate cyclase [Candidatus Reidiella endopervernicosa]QKQ27869.1 diguanylate cyclase [Candidatus Reidiella endopervernicosa]